MANRNCAVLAEFVRYCDAHPDERFWQALRNWSGFPFVMVGHDLPDNGPDLRDTYYWEGKNR